MKVFADRLAAAAYDLMLGAIFGTVCIILMVAFFGFAFAVLLVSPVLVGSWFCVAIAREYRENSMGWKL